MIETDAGYGTLAEAATRSTEAQNAADVLADRRRPGRTAVIPTLVPLLRGEHDPAIMLDAPSEEGVQESDWDDEGALRPARGIVYGLLLSLPLWAALFATCHVAIRMMTNS